MAAASQTDTASLAGDLRDRRGFVAAYERHHRAVFRYAARRVGPQIAEEVTQQSFTEAWAGRHRFDPDKGTPIVWLLGIATHIVHRHERDEMRQLAVFASSWPDTFDPVGESEIVQQVVDRERLAAVARSLARMDRDTRDVVFMWATTGLEYSEIAAALGLPLSSVRSKLHRARQRLTAELGENFPIDEVL